MKTLASARLSRYLGPLVIASLLLSPGAMAQPTKEAKEQATALMLQGFEARDEKKDPKAALDAFRKAHTIMKVPSTGIEVARTLTLLGLFIEAQEAAQDVVDLPMPPSGKEPGAFTKARSDAKALIEQAKSKIGYLKINITGAKLDAVEVTIDDLSIAPDTLKGPVKQNPGKHTVVVKGPKTDTATVEVTPGETKEVSLNVKGAEKKKEEPPPPPPASTEAPPPKSAFMRPMPLIGFSLAGVGLIAGSVTGALTLSKASAIKKDCDGNACLKSKSSDIDSAKTMGLVSNISFAVAGVGAVIGVVGLMMKPEAPKETGKITVTPWFGVGSAGVVGQF